MTWHFVMSDITMKQIRAECRLRKESLSSHERCAKPLMCDILPSKSLWTFISDASDGKLGIFPDNLQKRSSWVVFLKAKWKQNEFLLLCIYGYRMLLFQLWTVGKIQQPSLWLIYYTNCKRIGICKRERRRKREREGEGKGGEREGEFPGQASHLYLSMRILLLFQTFRI